MQKLLRPLGVAVDYPRSNPVSHPIQHYDFHNTKWLGIWPCKVRAAKKFSPTAPLPSSDGFLECWLNSVTLRIKIGIRSWRPEAAWEKTAAQEMAALVKFAPMRKVCPAVPALGGLREG